MNKKDELEKVVISSGYFDPIHLGHIEYLQQAKRLFENCHHVVIVNNEIQTLLKKGFLFLPVKDRMVVIKELRCVDEIFESMDMDKSVCKSIETLAEKYNDREIYFAKGGDRHSYEIPEADICKKYGIQIRDGLGKKIQSSSIIIDRAVEHLVEFRKKNGYKPAFKN